MNAWFNAVLLFRIVDVYLYIYPEITNPRKAGKLYLKIMITNIINTQYVAKFIYDREVKYVLLKQNLIPIG